MPLYDYDCSACGRRFEVVHGVQVEGPTVCPICGNGPIRKAISAAAVHYKGSGWAKKERRGSAVPGTSRASSDGSASERDTRGGDTGSSAGASSATATRPVEAGTARESDAGSKSESDSKADSSSTAD